MGTPAIIPQRNRIPSVAFDPDNPKPDDTKELLRQLKGLLRSPIIAGKLIKSWKDPLSGASDTYELTDQHKLIDCIHLAPGVNKAIPHNLNREPEGWIVVRVLSGFNAATEILTGSEDRKNEIVLNSSTEAYIHLWIF